mgnify:CR=1 FL=1
MRTRLAKEERQQSRTRVNNNCLDRRRLPLEDALADDELVVVAQLGDGAFGAVTAVVEESVDTVDLKGGLMRGQREFSQGCAAEAAGQERTM